jgi:hypothetical protein
MPHSVVGGCDTAGQVHSVAVTGNYACVIGRRWTGTASIGFIELFDFSVPANCVRVGGCDISGSYAPHGVAAAGNRAYVADREGGFACDQREHSGQSAACGRL